jgi:hypothetical protein
MTGQSFNGSEKARLISVSRGGCAQVLGRMVDISVAREAPEPSCQSPSHILEAFRRGGRMDST